MRPSRLALPCLARPRLAWSLLLIVGLGGCDRSAQGPDPDPTSPAQVRYRVEFRPQWTRARFPVEYPDRSPLRKPHFSGWVATAHGPRYRPYAPGVPPTPGLEALAEKGRPDPLDEEIRLAIAAGDALGLSTTGPLRDLDRTTVFEVVVDDAHPQVAAVSMLAPSPDWFVGVDVDLRGTDGFVATKTVDAPIWDAGSDAGATYLADDRDIDPKRPVAPASPRHFERDGRPLAVGQLVFTRL